MPIEIGPNDGRTVLSNENVLNIRHIDRFRPSLKCNLFIPSYVHSLSIATEFIYSYVLKRFPKDYFETIHISGKHPFEDFRRLDRGDFAVKEPPMMAVSYSIQYDYNDNDIDYNLLSTNKYLKKAVWETSFFKHPSKSIYIGMDLEAMMITYNFKFRVETKAQQIDLFNRIRKIFRIGCTETVDIDADFHLDRNLMAMVAHDAGFNVDTNGDVIDSWNFVRYLNSHSQMPILYKLRLINQKYEYFLRMRNLPVHLDMRSQLSVDDGNTTGMDSRDFGIEMEIPVRFPAPRTFAYYNEGIEQDQIKLEPNSGITVYSMKVYDIPEENYKGWPIYGHSEYMAEENEEEVSEIDIAPLFVQPPDVKVGSSMNDIIDDSINQFISPDSFIEVALYSNDLLLGDNGRIPIRMDWENRKIILPSHSPEKYFYIAIYVDRAYLNSKVIEMTNGANNRIVESRSDFDQIKEENARSQRDQTHVVETIKYLDSNVPTYRNKAVFIANK